MIPLARRFSAATAALLAAAALPVWLHQATGATFDPCADRSALERLPAFGQRPTRLETRRNDFEFYPLSIGGEIDPPAGVPGPLHFWMLRTYEPFDFYGSPDSIVVLHPLPSDRNEMHALKIGSDVLTVHRRYDDSLGPTRFSQYVLIQGTRPVRHPFSGGLELALPQLLRGTQPMTLFVVQTLAEARNLPAIEATADAWMAQVWTDFSQACLP